jgi:hypothetical protein
VLGGAYLVHIAVIAVEPPSTIIEVSNLRRSG